jgi:hypothetical protein
MNTTPDIAAALGAIICPILVIAILLGHGSTIPMLVEGLTKLFQDISDGSFEN